MTQEITMSAVADVNQEAPAQPGIGRKLLWLGPTGIVVAVALSIGEFLLVNSQAGVLSAIAALTMTAPVLLVRRWPVAAAAIITVAAVLNGLLFGDLVRCGAAFPAAVYIAFVIGVYARPAGSGWGRSVAGLVLVLANLVAQWIWDSALNVDGAGFLLFGPPIALGLWAIGLGVAAFRTRRSAR